MPQDRTNVYAFTETTSDYPGYLSINMETDGSISFTVRSSGDGGKNQGTIKLPDIQVQRIVSALRFEVLRENGAGG